MLARKSVLILATNGIGAFFGLVTLFFIGRYMGPVPLGLFGFAFSIIGLASTLGDLGFDNAHTKRVSEGQDLADCIATYTYIKVALTLGFTALMLGAAIVWDHYRGFFDATTLPVIVLVITYYALFQLRKIPAVTFNALLYTAKTQALALVENLLKAPVVVVGALLFGFMTGRWVPFSDFVEPLAQRLGLQDGWTVETGAVVIAVGHIVGMVGSLFAGLFIMLRHRYPWGRFDRVLARRYLDFALPIALITVVSVVSRRVDTFMVGYFWSATDAGWYFASERIVTLLQIIPVAIGTLFFPMISKMAHQGDHDGVNRTSKETQRMMNMLMLPIVVLGLVFASEVIHIFLSDSFLPAAPTLRWLLLFMLASSFSGVPKNVIMGYDRPKVTLHLSLVVIFSNLILNTLFIPNSILGVPLLGMRSEGAALASFLAQTLAFVLLLYQSHRIAGVTHLGASIFKQFLAGGITAFLLLAAKHIDYWGGLDRWYELVAGAATGLALFVVLLALMGEITQKDVRLVRDTLDPRHMGRYIRDEIRTGGGKKGR